jgi:hypothetical protein
MRFFVGVAIILSACGAGPVADAGTAPDAAVEEDAGAVDAGAVDAGGVDAGAVDAGGVDAGGVDGGQDAGPASSRGSGKLTCVRNGTVNTSAGAKSYCVGSVAGVEFKVIEPDDVTSPFPMRLAVYVHGDGARAYVNDTALRIQAPWTTSHHVLYVAVLAPNRCAWWVKPGVNACDGGASVNDRDLAGSNAVALEQVITAVRAGWDVLDAPMLFGGASGGSIFLSASYLPRYGDSRTGVWALSCGGEIPWSPLVGASPEQSRLSFTWGDQDFLVPDITQAVGWFTDAGFPVDTRLIPGAQHCAFDHLGRTTEIWDLP